MNAINFSQSTAYRIAVWLNQALELDIAIDSKVEPHTWFQFSDDNGGVVHCASATPGEISKFELGKKETRDHYLEIIHLARAAISKGDSLEINDANLYVVFACLHEFGHYRQWKDLSAADYRALVDRRHARFDQLNKTILTMKKGYARGREAYQYFAKEYRRLPLEHESDLFALEQLQIVLRMGVGD